MLISLIYFSITIGFINTNINDNVKKKEIVYNLILEVKSLTLIKRRFSFQ